MLYFKPCHVRLIYTSLACIRACRLIMHRMKCRSDDGNVAVIFALCLVILTSLGGGVLDLSLSYFAKSKVQGIIDGATAQMGQVVKANLSRAVPISVDQAVALAKTSVQNQISENLSHITGIDASAINYQFDVQVTSGTASTSRLVTSQVHVQMSMPNHFLGIVGQKTTPINLASVATTNLPTFVNISFLLDTSQSMGIGGNAVSIKTMMSDANMNCMFACHDTSNIFANEYKYWKTNNIANDNSWLYLKCNPKLNVSTRLDDAKAAISATLSTLSSFQYNKYAATILTYGGFAVPSVWSPAPAPSQAIAEMNGLPLPQEQCPSGTQLAGQFISYLQYNSGLNVNSTNNPLLKSQDANGAYTKFTGADHFNTPTSALQNIVSHIEIEDQKYINDNNAPTFAYPHEGTDTDDALYDLSQTFNALGIANTNADGSSVLRPKQVVILLTDGTQYWDGWMRSSPMHNNDPLSGNLAHPLDLAACTSLKQYATLAVVYVPPIDVTDNSKFPNLINTPPFDLSLDATNKITYTILADSLTPNPLTPSAPYFLNKNYFAFLSIYGPSSANASSAPRPLSAQSNYWSTSFVLNGQQKQIAQFYYTPANNIVPPNVTLNLPNTSLSENLDATNTPIYSILRANVPFEYNMQQCATNKNFYYKVDTTDSTSSASSASSIASALANILRTVDQSVVLSR